MEIEAYLKRVSETLTNKFEPNRRGESTCLASRSVNRVMKIGEINWSVYHLIKRKVFQKGNMYCVRGY